ncbi:biotin transport system substrate-specific component [Scopulibacillus darangshiensis]|uniref:Biotin transporter n=1 Tax=Scopulibacillus darangshiensis TaxID=442528 RepID=A0A4R2PAW4_9BACL|nr:biotin transporter BioY [Scopulibacillus darangshiensis]TCP31528.1 biotin transport system substrate-specific component [Scopulibacillus darangshiensis]
MIRTKTLVFISLFVAMIAVMGLIPPIPLPFIGVPITLQTLGVMLAGGLLGAKKGFTSTLVFVLIVAAGGPFLAGGRGGFGTILGPSGGYILAWPIGALVIGLLTERLNASSRFYISKLVVSYILGGIIIVYAGGIFYYSWVAHSPLGITALGNLAFLPGDFVKVAISVALTVKLKPYFNTKRTHHTAA